jgi:hypothetical protein
LVRYHIERSYIENRNKDQKLERKHYDRVPNAPVVDPRVIRVLRPDRHKRESHFDEHREKYRDRPQGLVLEICGVDRQAQHHIEPK